MKEEKVKQIHVYRNLCNENEVSDKDLESMLIDYESTMKAINSNKDIIKTTQITVLIDTWFYIDKGYDIFVHSNETITKIEEGMVLNGKKIRRGHNMLKLCFFNK